MTENVYTKVAAFYKKNNVVEDVLPRQIVEQYLRGCAWRGASDRELQDNFELLALLAVYAVNAGFDSLADMQVYDYYDFLAHVTADGNIEQLTEKEVNCFFDVIRVFYSFLAKLGYGDFVPALDAARMLFYREEKFAFPARDDVDELAELLDNIEFITPEEAERLDLMLDRIMWRMTEFFQEDKYRRDLVRAIALYAGPMWDGKTTDEDFWLSFWDYFFFDYHMLEHDVTPLVYYCRQTKTKLKPSELSVLDDLKSARFAVFGIESLTDTSMICKDIFTGEQYELPIPDYGINETKKVLCFGHLHRSEGIMLNYVTSLAASSNLRHRMKEEILKLFSLYEKQVGKTTLQEFFVRHAVAIRHVLLVLAKYAKLQVVDDCGDIEPYVKAQLTPEMESFEKELGQMALKIGYSKYSLTFLCRLYEDYLQACREKKQTIEVENKTLQLALVMLFAKVNGLSLQGEKKQLSAFGTSIEAAKSTAEEIEKLLDCEEYDVRYLTEEGYVQRIYRV